MYNDSFQWNFLILERFRLQLVCWINRPRSATMHTKRVILSVAAHLLLLLWIGEKFTQNSSYVRKNKHACEEAERAGGAEGVSKDLQFVHSLNAFNISHNILLSYRNCFLETRVLNGFKWSTRIASHYVWAFLF